MYIYSGNYRWGVCGEKTKLQDSFSSNLFVGDIVVLRDSHTFYSLSVVVRDTCINYTNGKKEDSLPFVMGIKDEEFMLESNNWEVTKIKSYKDVIEGEHFSDYGFRYSCE